MGAAYAAPEVPLDPFEKLLQFLKRGHAWEEFFLFDSLVVFLLVCLLRRQRTGRICSFCSMRIVSADPRTHRLMMHVKLASDVTVTHPLFRKCQGLCFSRLIGFPDTSLRGEVQLARTTAETLTPRSIFPAFEDLRNTRSRALTDD